ncbi:MAG: hypothetical protein QXU11_11720, partial [Thermoproteota archaeon]
MKPIEDNKLESVVATHLARKYPTFYWRGKTEVDVVVMIDNKQVGIEVKTVSGSWIKPKHLKDYLVLAIASFLNISTASSTTPFVDPHCTRTISASSNLYVLKGGRFLFN